MAEHHEAAIAGVIASAMKEAVFTLSVSGNVSIPDDHTRKVERALSSMASEAIKKSGADTLSDIDELFRKDDDLFDLFIEEFFAAHGAEAVRRISDTTREQMAALLHQGLEQGKTLPQIAATIRDAIPDISRIRAATIARTETHSAAMFASQRTAQTSNLPLMKEWLSVEDHRTRDFGEADGEVDDFSHRAMNGVSVPVNDMFMVPRKDGTEEGLLYPGDPNASAANRINCRCVQRYVRAKA